MIPRALLRQLYTFGSLRNTTRGVAFELKNRLVPVTVRGVGELRLNGRVVPPERVRLSVADHPRAPAEITPDAPLPLPVREVIDVELEGVHLDEGHHSLDLTVEVADLGALTVEVEDVLATDDGAPKPWHIPHSDRDDYSADLIAARQRMVTEHTGVELEHVASFSFEPHQASGNIENFTGVAQVPLGFAGPIRIHGEHADGEFLVPLATTEGTLVASYNRGIKVLNLAGGVTCTVSDDAMQRAPVFVFGDAREARDFTEWVQQRLEEIREVAEATSSVARLLYVDTFCVSKLAYLRFNFSTGDAAGQNMVGRATFAACQWILEQVDGVQGFYLESNVATDKKHSHLNLLKTRGKRVTAECTVPRDLLISHLRVTPEQLDDHARLGTIGSLLSGAVNNGAHSANGITAMFIATGQDVANVAESSAAILYSEVTPSGDLYLSVTVPSLIVATHGGGTALPTQRECLRVLGCTGRGSVRKLAEIMAGVVLAGELSLGAAISGLDWVSSHERLGRNR